MPSTFPRSDWSFCSWASRERSSRFCSGRPGPFGSIPARGARRTSTQAAPSLERYSGPERRSRRFAFVHYVSMVVCRRREGVHVAGKVLVNLATGMEDAERVTVAFLVATAALDQG